MNTPTRYLAMRDGGATAAEVHAAAVSDGVDRIEVIRLLREVFGLDLRQAKEAIARAEGAATLSDAQGRLVGDVNEALQREEEEG